MSKLLSSPCVLVRKKKHKNIEKKNSEDMRDQSCVKDTDAPLDAKQVKKEPPPIAKKRISSLSKADDSNKPPCARKVTPKAMLHKRRQSDTLVEYDENQNPIDKQSLDESRFSIADINRSIDVKDPKMADTSELEENDEDYGNPCNNCNLCTHGWDLHIWRNMCRNCNCSREEHANPNNTKDKINVVGPRKANNQPKQQTNSNNELTIPLMTKERNPPPVSPKVQRRNTKERRRVSQENNKSLKDDVKNTKVERRISRDDRRHSTGETIGKDNIPKGGVGNTETVKPRTRLDPKERLKKAAEEKRKSELNFLELDSMIDELLDGKVEDEKEGSNAKVLNLDDFANNIENQPKSEGKLYEQIKRKIGSKSEDKAPPKPTKKQERVEIISDLSASDQSSTESNEQENCSDNTARSKENNTTSSNKLQRMDNFEESMQRNLQMLEEDVGVSKSEGTNKKDDSVTISQTKRTYFGLKDLESKILEIMKMGDIDAYESEETPKSAEDIHRRNFIEQIPPNDFLVLRHIEELDKYELKEKELFLIHLHKQAIGRAMRIEANKITESLCCSYCATSILPTESFKVTERPPDQAYHHDCFRCNTCDQSLVDDIYFSKTGNIYCGRHYSEIYKSRCTECDELIFSQEYTVAEEQKWHMKHFCCFVCDVQLGGESYVRDSTRTYCIPCYHEAVANRCEACMQAIQIGTEWINFEERNWHASSSCFCCQACKRDLCDMPFVPLGDSIYCSLECLKS